jgi:cell division protein FtsW
MHTLRFAPALVALAASAIFMIGMVMIFSATSAEVLDNAWDKSTHQVVIRQTLYALAGIAMAVGIWKWGYAKILEFSPIILAVFTFFLILTLIPGIGREVNGSKRWISLFGLSFQPSEFVKYLVPAYFIHRYLQYPNGELSFKEFLKIVATVSVPMVLILIEPNNGTTAVIAMTLIVLCWLTCIPFKYWAWPLLAAVIVGGAFAANLGYVNARLKVYLNPELDLKGKGHQPYQAKIAAGSGGLLGKGPGNSLQKLSYLPEAQNDYIAAIYAEEFGFAGILALIAMYLALAYGGYRVAFEAHDLGGAYYAGAITFLISFQAFLNLGVVSGLLPSTGLNLPLFSQGGTSLLANIVGLGLLLSIARGKST